MSRKTAVLTKTQREYLRGEREPAQEGTMRTRIRDRLRAGLQDISLLLHSDRFDSNDIRAAVDDEDLNPEGIEELMSVGRDSHAINLVTLAVLVEKFTPEYEASTIGQDPSEEPESTLGIGVREAFHELGESLASIDITIERGPPFQKLLEMDRSELSDAQLLQLHTVGYLSQKEYATAVNRRRAAEKFDEVAIELADDIAAALAETEAPALSEFDVDNDDIEDSLRMHPDELADRVAASDLTEISPSGFQLEYRGDGSVRIHPIVDEGEE